MSFRGGLSFTARGEEEDEISELRKLEGVRDIDDMTDNFS